MKLVVDTNVLVSGTLWKGNPARLLDALLDGTATLCLSAALLAEFGDVIQRQKFKTRLEQSRRSATEIISRFGSMAVVVDEVAVPIPETLPDPDDVHVFACALISGADAIVTGDNDLLAMKAFRNVPILTVRQALEKLEIAPE